MWSQSIVSPIGRLLVRVRDDAVVAIDFAARSQPTERPNELTRRCCHQLEEYFAGTRQVFDLPLARQGTPFQQSVWQALTNIPFGTTWSYLDLAIAIGNRRAVRAVGGANGRNPLPIVVPCHRVIGRDGSLVGFGGGLDRKRWLLSHEGSGLPIRQR